MTTTVSIDKFVKISQDDPEWIQFSEDNDQLPRAEFEFSEDCPDDIRQLIAKAHGNDQFKLVAYVPESQVFMEMMCGSIQP
jgi:hypothetical protein